MNNTLITYRAVCTNRYTNTWSVMRNDSTCCYLLRVCSNRAEARQIAFELTSGQSRENANYEIVAA